MEALGRCCSASRNHRWLCSGTWVSALLLQWAGPAGEGGGIQAEVSSSWDVELGCWLKNLWKGLCDSLAADVGFNVSFYS